MNVNGLNKTHLCVVCKKSTLNLLIENVKKQKNAEKDMPYKHYQMKVELVVLKSYKVNFNISKISQDSEGHL